MKPEPKFKHGDKVKVDGSAGVCTINTSYWEPRRKTYQYSAKQGEYLLGNVPEDWITKVR